MQQTRAGQRVFLSRRRPAHHHFPALALPASILTGADLNNFVSADLNVQIKLPWKNILLTGTVFNIFDAAPPFAREDYNYEPFVGNPYGRMFKLGLSTKF